jgi:RNA-binding protein YhbY
MPLIKFQIGKQGLTENFLKNLENSFKTNKNIKIYVLKSARPSGKDGKAYVENYSKEILKKLGDIYTANTIGFTINLKKWRNPVR